MKIYEAYIGNFGDVYFQQYCTTREKAQECLDYVMTNVFNNSDYHSTILEHTLDEYHNEYCNKLAKALE